MIERPRYLHAGELYRVTTCRSCGAAIVWALMIPSRKRTPVDALPRPEGNLILIDPPIIGDPPRCALVSRKLIAETDPREHPRHTSHFATCADAKAWRKT